MKIIVPVVLNNKLLNIYINCYMIKKLKNLVEEKNYRLNISLEIFHEILNDHPDQTRTENLHIRFHGISKNIFDDAVVPFDPCIRRAFVVRFRLRQTQNSLIDIFGAITSVND